MSAAPHDARWGREQAMSNKEGERQMEQAIERVGKFKVRLGRPGLSYVEKYIVWREGDKLFISRHYRTPVRPVDPPQDYPGRRSEGLIEFEVVS